MAKNKYIDAGKLSAEIENIYSEAICEYKSCKSRYSEGVLDAIHRISSFIISLQQEQSELDLEKETKRWWKEHLHLHPENQLWMDAHQSVVFARYFFELGRARKEEK